MNKDKEAEKILVKLMQKEPVKVLNWMLVQLGKEMKSTNAATMEMTQSFDLDKQRYGIKAKIELSKTEFETVVI